MLKIKPWDWEDEQLRNLTKLHLQSLCDLLGISRGGTRTKLIERLKVVASVRCVLRGFKDDAQRLADSFLGRELKAMCKKVKCFAPGTKYGI